MQNNIDVENILRNVLRQWFYILVLSAIIAFSAGVLSLQAYQPSYRTQALIAVYGKNSNGAVVYDAQDTADVFREVITSNLLQKKVAEEMGLRQLPGTISVENIPYTNMLTVTVTASSPQAAWDTIQGVLTHHSVVTNRLMGEMVLQLLEAPAVPEKPVQGYSGQGKLFKLFLGSILLIGVMFAFIFCLRDDIKNENMVEEKLETNLLAAIYHEQRSRNIKARTKHSHKREKGFLVTNPAISFGFTETYQKLGTRIIQKTKEKGQKVILVTSLMENEGKSTVAVNLALTLSRMGKRVLMIDLDLHKPALHKLLELNYGSGKGQITDVLSGAASLRESIRKCKDTGLYVLAGNKGSPDSNVLLNQQKIEKMLQGMKSAFDYVILDTPPMGAVADTETIMRSSDCGILVVRQNGALAGEINDTIYAFSDSGCELLGCVLNDVFSGLPGGKLLGRDRYQDKYYHGYGYGRYYT